MCYGKGKKSFDRPTNSLGILFSQSIDGLNAPKSRFFPSPASPPQSPAVLVPSSRAVSDTRACTHYLNITAIERSHPSGVTRSPRCNARKKRSNNFVDAGLRMHTISQYRSINCLSREAGRRHLSRCTPVVGPSMQRGNSIMEVFTVTVHVIIPLRFSRQSSNSSFR